MTTHEKMLWFAAIALIGIADRKLYKIDEKLNNKFNNDSGYETDKEIERRWNEYNKKHS